MIAHLNQSQTKLSMHGDSTKNVLTGANRIQYQFNKPNEPNLRGPPVQQPVLSG